MKLKKTILSLALIFVFSFGFSFISQGAVETPEEKPLMTVACISDPHSDHANKELKSWTVMRDVAGSLEDQPTDSPENLPTTEGETEMILFDLILASAGGVIALGGIITLIIVLYRMWKKDRATPYKD